jgi:hypothetical protein
MHARHLTSCLLTTAFLFAAQDGTSAAANASDTAPACIAIAPPSVQGVDGSAADFSLAVRDLFASYLTGPAIQPVALESRLASQALLEARQKDCPQVLVASLTRKRSGGGRLAKALGSAAGAAAWHAPYAAGASSAVAYGTAAAGAHAASAIASDTRRKDELRLEYRLVTADGAVVLPPKTDKAKASEDGEDLLTPLVERAAQSVAPAITPPGQ